MLLHYSTLSHKNWDAAFFKIYPFFATQQCQVQVEGHAASLFCLDIKRSSDTLGSAHSSILSLYYIAYMHIYLHFCNPPSQKPILLHTHSCLSTSPSWETAHLLHPIDYYTCFCKTKNWPFLLVFMPFSEYVVSPKPCGALWAWILTGFSLFLK